MDANTTELRFRPRPERVAFDLSRYPPDEELGPAALRFLYFTHRVALSVGGTEIFGPSESPFTNIGVLHAALGLREALDGCEDLGESGFDSIGGGGVDVRFRCDGSGTVQLSGINGGVASDSIASLRGALDAFDEAVRSFLLGMFPDLLEHPRYGWWFRGE